MSIKVVTYATNVKDQLKNWELLVKHFNYDYTILGLGEKWNGWCQRTKAYLDFVRIQEPNQIVVLCDSYDVLIIDSPTNLHNKFIKMKKNVIVSAEPQCCTGKMNLTKNKYNFTNICKKRAPKHNQFIYPCAGCVMGYAKDLAIMYDMILHSKFDKDDQSALDNLWIKDIKLFELDYKSNIFGNIYTSNFNLEWEFTKEKNSLTRKKYKTTPSILHFPASKGIFVNFNVYNTVGKNIMIHSSNNKTFIRIPGFF